MTALFERPASPALAFRFREGQGPAIVFLPGYASDMTGGKATALWEWAVRTGRPLLLFDYSGCGASEGAFEDGTLARWRDDALDLIDASHGPLVLIGSSMGGWLMLLVALARPERVHALIGVAAAPDFTDWGFTQEQKLTLLREGRIVEPSPYGGNTITTRGFWQSGEACRVLQCEIAIHCPVRLLHGQADADVPWSTALHLAERLRSADVQLTLVKDGDHRLSRDPDIALLLATLEATLERL
jgi:pimeloyl-ACP methyl ester carboxylesterase